jgi:hypothetical protein
MVRLRRRGGSFYLLTVAALMLLAAGCGNSSSEKSAAEDKAMRESLNRTPRPEEIPPQARAMMGRGPSAPGAAVPNTGGTAPTAKP